MKKLRIFIVFIMLVCYPTFSYAQIYKQADIGNGSYIIGTYLFNKEKTATYNGTLTTPMIMMASKTITGNDLTNKKIYFKNSRGKWINAITGQSESNIPSTFEITCVNMNCQNNISPVIDSYDTYKNSDIVNGAYIIGTHIFNKDKNDVYNGTLTTPMIMLASKTITGNALSDMNIYFKNSRGKWISAITGKIIDSVPSNFNISHINLNKTESKDKATDTITITAKTTNYTGNGIQPTVKTTSGLTPTLTYYSDSSCATKTTTSNAVSAGGAPKNVGTYYVKATTTGNADYNASSLGCTKAVVINKANATCPTLTEYSGTYDGTAKKITVSGGKGGTVQYRTSTTGTWSNTNPGRTNAGTSTVYVQVLGDSNHNTVDCGSKTLKVNKKAITVTATNQSNTYSGSALTADSTCKVTTGSLVSGHALTCTSTGTQINAGSSTKTLSKVVVTNGTTDVSSNYEITKKNGTLTVNKATDKITVTAKTSNYTGSGIQPTVKTTSGLTATLTYYSDSSCATKTTTSNAVSAGGTPKNAGTYYVKATTAGNTNYDASSLSCTKAVVINKVNATCPTLTGYSGNYDGNAHTITVSGETGGTIQYRTSATGTWSNTKPTRTGVGTSTVYVQVLGDSNHNTVDCGSETIKINSVPVESIHVQEEETLYVGDRFLVMPRIDPFDATDQSVTYSAGNETVASVDANGIITAHKGGVSTITATSSNGKKAKIKITVQNPNLIMGYLKVCDQNDINELEKQERDACKFTDIINANTKETIVLKGYNVGAWLSRSYSMSAVVPLPESDINSTDNPNGNYSCINNESFYQALKKNSNLINDSEKSAEELANDLSMVWYENFMQELDWDLISQSGANVIRLPFEYGLFDKLGKEKAFVLIDQAIAECKKRGIYVIIDLHLAPGRQNSGGYCGTQQFLADNDLSEEERSRMVELWGDIAKYYVNEPAVAAYDLLNEPGPADATERKILLQFYDDAYQVIRAVDKKHIIIMEEDCVYCGYGNRPDDIGFLPHPTDGSSNEKYERTINWTNVMYSTHDYFAELDYECHAGDNPVKIKELPNGTTKEVYCVSPDEMNKRFKNKISVIKKKMNDYKIPYYIGEFSYLGDTDNKKANKENSLYDGYLSQWRHAVDEYYKSGINYTTWTYKANEEPFFGTVYYSTRDYYYDEEQKSMVKYEKANLLEDSYDTLIKKFSLKSSEYMYFNSDLYGILTRNFGGRYVDHIHLMEDQTILTDKNGRRQQGVVDLEQTITLKKGQTLIISYDVNPDNAIQKQATWVIEQELDENGIKVDKKGTIVGVNPTSGKITALKKGSATIKAIVYPLKNPYCKVDENSSSGMICGNENTLTTDSYHNDVYPSATINVIVEE